MAGAIVGLAQRALHLSQQNVIGQDANGNAVGGGGEGWRVNDGEGVGGVVLCFLHVLCVLRLVRVDFSGEVLGEPELDGSSAQECADAGQAHTGSSKGGNGNCSEGEGMLSDFGQERVTGQPRRHGLGRGAGAGGRVMRASCSLVLPQKDCSHRERKCNRH